MNKPSFISPRLLDGLAVAAFLAAVLFGLLIGTEPTTLVDSMNTAIRVEVHRYMGYEDLLVRYLSLPYDLTVNSNETINALDIGFPLLVFVPLLLLWGLKKDWMKWAVMGLCLFLVVISTSTGRVYGEENEKVETNSQVFAEYVQTLSFSEEPVRKVVTGFYTGFSKIYTNVLEKPLQLAGEKSPYVYPVLLGFFLLFFFISRDRMTEIGRSQRGFFVFLLTYLFLFLILSAGVIWYGFLAFPLLLLSVCWSFYKNKDAQSVHHKILHYGFLFSVGAMVFLGFAQRLSYISISSIKIDTLKGKRLYDPSLLRYQTGEYQKEDVLNGFFPNIVPALAQINQETESLIYKVSGRYNFFIEKNDKRIFADDQLDFFQIIANKYQDKIKISNLLKDSGFRYIIVDLLLPTLDNTPEKALVSKFEFFQSLLYKNPKVKLLATDRVVITEQNNKPDYAMFGDIQRYGTYAIFEIQ